MDITTSWFSALSWFIWFGNRRKNAILFETSNFCWLPFHIGISNFCCFSYSRFVLALCGYMRWFCRLLLLPLETRLTRFRCSLRTQFNKPVWWTECSFYRLQTRILTANRVCFCKPKIPPKRLKYTNRRQRWCWVSVFFPPNRCRFVSPSLSLR